MMNGLRGLMGILSLLIFLLGRWLPTPEAFESSWQQPTASARDTATVLADTLIRRLEDGEPVYLLIGNVKVLQGNTLLSSYRAIQYIERETFLFSGNVQIVERGDSMYADTIFYDKRLKVGRARGNVRLLSEDAEVTAPSARYFVEEKKALFEEGVKLVDSRAEVTSQRGIYWSDEKRAELDTQVRLHSEESLLEADSLTYFRETQISIARGHVIIDRLADPDEADTTLRNLIFSQYTYHDEKNRKSRMEGNPLLLQLRQDATGVFSDTLLIQSQHLEAVENDTLQHFTAVGAVRIWQHDRAARADSVVYLRLFQDPDALPADTLDADTLDIAWREQTHLFKDPILWVGSAQITGENIRLDGHDGLLDSLFVPAEAFVAQYDSLTQRIHQLRGQQLRGFLQGDRHRFTLGPQAEIIYFRHDEENRPDGGIQASADKAVFIFEDDEVKRVDFSGDPQGTYYTEALLPDPFELGGFDWKESQRPHKDALMEQVWIRLWLEGASIFKTIQPSGEVSASQAGTVGQKP